MQEHDIPGLPLTQITQVFLENKKTQVVGIESFWGKGNKVSVSKHSFIYLYLYIIYIHN